MSGLSERERPEYDNRLITCPECRSTFEAEDSTICRSDAEIKAEALREAARDLGTEPKVRVLVERESCDWWTERPVSAWLRDRADALEVRS